ncbi:unnamed protein product, partial [Dibothriocephalus latus]
MGRFWFQGHGYTQLNEEIDRAIKDAVARILAALKEDENSIKLNYDYVFYPHLSPELLPAKQFNDWSVSSQACAADGHVPLLIPPPTMIPEGTVMLPETDDEDASGCSPAADSPVDRFRGAPIQSSMTQLPVDYNVLPQHQIPMPPTSTHEFAGCGPTQYPMGLGEGAESLQSYATTQNPNIPYAQRDTEVFITLKVPVYAQSLLAQIANHMNSKVRRTPILVVPGDATS